VKAKTIVVGHCSICKNKAVSHIELCSKQSFLNNGFHFVTNIIVRNFQSNSERVAYSENILNSKHSTQQ